MPSPVTPRRSSGRAVNKTPVKKPVDIGKPLGPYDNNQVRDRVRQWQAQGGGVVTTPDPCAEHIDDEQSPKKLGKEGSQKKVEQPVQPPQDAVLLQAQASAAQEKVDDETTKENKAKSISTPRKRIISDGHWVRKRSPPKSAEKAKPKPKPKPTIRRQSFSAVRSRPKTSKISNSNGDAQDSKAEDVDKEKSKVFDDGIRVYATPPSSRRASAQQDIAKEDKENRDVGAVDNDALSLRSRSVSPKSGSSAGNPGTLEVTPEGSPKPVKLKPSSSKRNSEVRSTSLHKETATQSPTVEDGNQVNERRKSKKAGKGFFAQAFDESRRMFTRTETVYIQPSENPRIDAWLGGVPDPSDDPFVVEEAPLDEPPVEIPAPLNVKSRRKRRSKESEAPVEDPNRIWESVATKETPPGSSPSRPRRHRTNRGSRVQEDVSIEPSESVKATRVDKEGAEPEPATTTTNNDPRDTTPTSPASTSRLQRRNARRKSIHSPRESPRRDERQSSPLKDSSSPPNEEEKSQVSSANTESSVEPIGPNNPLKPLPLTSRRPFPSVGQHRLSTILSVDTLGSKARTQAPASVSEFSDATLQPNIKDNREMRREAEDPLEPSSLGRTTSKSRLTRHADLLSVLSAPRGGEKSIRSARSIRTNRSRLETATMDDVFKELEDDETKYMRELRTLVDGVIPVLLSSVLSKTESALAAGLFSPQGNAAKDPAITKPIIDMGICLERLKAWHKRIEPRNGRPPSVTSFLNWASGVHKTYTEYLKSWRMGFQDVVVNLAPASANEQKDAGIEGGLPRNEHGDVTDGNGERVDVAFLLKRPLVRLKYLAKTLRGINHVSPSTQAEKLAIDFQSLVEEARNRTNEERARLEDEAAANIDATRARDPRTLGLLSNTSINKARRVRARDSYDLTLLHTSGQQIDCRVELLLRDDPPGEGLEADLLICEVDGTGRWLLFPPISTDRVSARNGDAEREIVVMVRGEQSSGQEWQEILSLVGDEEQAGFEWVQMLGLTPIPPQISATSSLGKTARRKTLESSYPSETLGEVRAGNASVPTTPTKNRTPNPRDIEIPLGEQATGSSKIWRDPLHVADTPKSEFDPPKSRTRLQKRTPNRTPEPGSTDPFIQPLAHQERLSSDRGESGSVDSPASPTSVNDDRTKEDSPGLGLRRYLKNRGERASRGSSEAPGSPISPTLQGSNSTHPRSPDPTTLRSSVDEKAGSTSPGTPPLDEVNKSPRPRYHHRTSSVPSTDLPTIRKQRNSSEPPAPGGEVSQAKTEPAETTPSGSPKKLTKPRPQGGDIPPPPPPHRTPSPIKLEGAKTPDFSPGLRKAPRRSSSPLKHEYEPSTATESTSGSDSEGNDDVLSSRSDTSGEEDEDSEEGDVAMPLLPVGALQRSRPPPASMPSLPSKTLGPSSSASQAPYKTVPSQPQKASRAIALIYYWSESGKWENLHPDECSIAITPGLIEAYEMSAAHSYAEEHGLASSNSGLSSGSSISAGSRPLVALELTPLVPIRRGTAIDISIRSPPTSGSKITTITSNNVMFRSRNSEECEILYGLINYSRINNPTYIALQNARATSFAPQLVNAGLNRGKTARAPASSWFGLGRRRSYRASSAPTPSISKTESSINSASSAFSALKIFKGSSRFSINRSTILSRTSSRTGSVYTSSDNSSGTSTPIPPGSGSGSGTTPGLPSVPGGGVEANAAPIGLSNAKIRLYIRESASKWRDLGSARLTIMRPTNASHPLFPSSSSTPDGRDADADSPGHGFGIGAGGAASPGRRQTASDKRIVVIGKSKEQTLLDVTLGESCFERVARTGIAVSVWENFEGGMVAKEGGVVGGRLRVFMIQVCFVFVFESLRGGWG